MNHDPSMSQLGALKSSSQVASAQFLPATTQDDREVNAIMVEHDFSPPPQNLTAQVKGLDSEKVLNKELDTLDLINPSIRESALQHFGTNPIMSRESL